MPDPTKKGKKGTKKKLLVPKESKKKMRLMTDEDFAEKKMLKVKEKLKPKSLTDKTSEFPIDMNSPFKMAYQNKGGAPALMKTLVENSPIKKVGDKKSDAPKGFKSDMGDYEPTITASTKTLGGTGGAPYTNSKGEIKKKGEKLARGGKVLSTQGNTKKRDKTTRQKVRQVTYKS
jgi:hypothetical protein